MSAYKIDSLFDEAILKCKMVENNIFWLIPKYRKEILKSVTINHQITVSYAILSLILP